MTFPEIPYFATPDELLAYVKDELKVPVTLTIHVDSGTLEPLEGENFEPIQYNHDVYVAEAKMPPGVVIGCTIRCDQRWAQEARDQAGITAIKRVLTDYYAKNGTPE